VWDEEAAQIVKRSVVAALAAEIQAARAKADAQD
jgi:hypothetical protein